MAQVGFLDTILNSLEQAVRTPVKAAFEYIARELALGDNTKAENFSWYRVTGTTHATANTEFSILHGMDHAPTKLIPILRLDSSGGQIVTLTVTRAADSKRLYLKSASTGVMFQAFLE